jgi:3-(3-hydroxy-phenyl)propionate hydroxylase
MKTHSVVIAGAGPAGMMLGAELKLAGVDAVVIEPRLTPELSGARAGGRGLHTRTIEVFDMRGIAERFISQGQAMQVLGFNKVPIDISDFPTRHPYGLSLLQKHTERIMAEWVEEIGVNVLRGHEVVGFTQDDSGVTVDVQPCHPERSEGSARSEVQVPRSAREDIRAQYLVGCDGGRSHIRKTAGIDFLGSDATMSWLIAEVRMTEKPQFGFKQDAVGAHAMGPIDDRVGLVLVEPEVRDTSERTLDDLKAGLIRVYGTDFGVHSPNYISSFTDATRQAASYRKGRVLLAGDAAHIHPPLGGKGLNLGVQDAFNLGWKLAQVVKGISPDSLLDTYHTERHPVGARALKETMAHVAVGRLDDRSKALSDLVTDWLKTDEVRKRMGTELSGLGIRYDLGEGHPLLGARMPDLEIITAAGPTRVFSLLHEAQPLLINFGEPGAAANTWGDHVRVIDAKYHGTWDLPAVGIVPSPTAVFVRPDGYIAWVK